MLITDDELANIERSLHQHTHQEQDSTHPVSQVTETFCPVTPVMAEPSSFLSEKSTMAAAHLDGEHRVFVNEPAVVHWTVPPPS